MVKLDTRPDGGMALDSKFFLEMDAGCAATRCGSRRGCVKRLVLFLMMAGQRGLPERSLAEFTLSVAKGSG